MFNVHQKTEYRCDSIFNEPAESVERTLNDAAAEGWEFVAMSSDKVVFRRTLTDLKAVEIKLD